MKINILHDIQVYLITFTHISLTGRPSAEEPDHSKCW